MKLIGVFILSMWGGQYVGASVLLSEKVIKIAEDSAILSSAVYLPQPNVTGFDEFEYFVDEADADAAILAEKDGYCHLSFRGSTMNLNDWYKTLKTSSDNVCSEASAKSCCDVRKGFFDAYIIASYKSSLEFKTRRCVLGCRDKEECLVISGHSDGGAIAAVAGILFESYKPYVVTFGEPPSVKSDCKFIDVERWIRFVNTVESDSTALGIAFDPVPFAPGMGNMIYGQFIILTDDGESDLPYIGLDSTKDYLPLNFDGADSHNMIGDSDEPGYLDRITTLIKNTKSYPIVTAGFKANNICKDHAECPSNKCEKDEMFSYKMCVDTECVENRDCATGRCYSGGCLPRFGSCMECIVNTDCASNKCLLFRCANIQGKMDDNCRCLGDNNCDSVRCDGISPPVCKPRLEGGEFCDEHSDCITDRCNWYYHCTGESSGDKQNESSLTFMFWIILAVGSLGFIFYEHLVTRIRGGYTPIKEHSTHEETTDAKTNVVID